MICIAQWRASLAKCSIHFPSSSQKCHRRGNLISCFFKTIDAIESSYESAFAFPIKVVLLCIILIEIACSTLSHLFTTSATNYKKHHSTGKLILLYLLLLNPSFLSILLRLLLLRSGNVDPNPGPAHSKFLSFGVWNVDSLLARDGIKKSHIECIQSNNNFDIFGVCETYLTKKIEDSQLEIDGFSSVVMRSDLKSSTPDSRPRGGVCLYYKDNLPIKRRTDLELLGETICAEISLNRKKIIYILSYRSPSQNSAEFKMYMQQLQIIYSKACSENPASIILCGDFNARSPLLWSGENTELPEGRDLADFCTLNSLEQMVKDATHEPNSTTSTCIDLILTNQPFLFVDSGVIHSPDSLLKHQIIFGKLNFNVPCPPPYKRKIWDFTLAHTLAIKSQMTAVPWDELFLNMSLDDTVKSFTDIFLSIITKNIPNKIVTINDKDAPWISSSLRNLLHKDRKIFSDWKHNGRPQDGLARVKNHQEKTKNAISSAKNQFIKNLSNKICDPSTGRKSFWSAYKRLSNRKKLLIFPPCLKMAYMYQTLRKRHPYSIAILHLNVAHLILIPHCRLSLHSPVTRCMTSLSHMQTLSKS